ncbi:unnamed protein product [Brassicogethes aeneus]|uniref:Trehalase n=1 Tax=Brassicogethes aeneus TaxID=1431903 RepID=A0A9P0BJ35_BRAAE|nr:unnamed protein product [Brassicogethes aeneus]
MEATFYFALTLLGILNQVQVNWAEVDLCDSQIYCHGTLLDTIQMASVFKDSKTFVDMSLKNSPEETLTVFNNLMKNTSNEPTHKQLTDFVEENFETGSELEEWTPSDYTETPMFLERINSKDGDIKEFAQDLVKIWPTLGRKVSSKVSENPEKYSLIAMPNGFIIPGGRFKEIYYWDTYWIIKGLLLSDMKTTVKGILENFLSFVEKYGFIPNGSRVYYLNRSQPPLLSWMVMEYIKATNDLEWLKTNIHTLERELNYWIKNKTVNIDYNGEKIMLAHYAVDSDTPRPESYLEDSRTCAYQQEGNARKNCYQDLKSGAESGWDFSTRWIFQDDTKKTNLSDIKTRRNIPVDLNAFLQRAFADLGELYKKIGNYKKSKEWRNYASLWNRNINTVLYDEKDGIWYDYDNVKGVLKKGFYPSNFAPLFSMSYDFERSEILGDRAAEYFERMNVTKYSGGIPTSLILSGEQWDLPNAWPPTQDMVVTGLHKTKSKKAQSLAELLATRWIRSNQMGFKQSGEMFEKYDAEIPGQFGGGGEYVVQSGFGWTNGVVLSFIDEFFTIQGY